MNFNDLFMIQFDPVGLQAMRRSIEAFDFRFSDELLSTETSLAPILKRFGVFAEVKYNRGEPPTAAAGGGDAEAKAKEDLVSSLQKMLLAAIHVGLITNVTPRESLIAAMDCFRSSVLSLPALVWSPAYQQRHETREVTLSFPVFLLADGKSMQTELLSFTIAGGGGASSSASSAAAGSTK